MPETLPERIWPFRMARGGESVDARMAVARMPRLRALLADAGAEATVQLQFDTDDAGRARIDGRVAAELSLTCQRCLQPVVIGVSSEIHLAPVESDAEARRVEDPYEPLLLTREPVSLRTLVEDELLLALPIVALHEGDSCRAPLESGPKPEPTEMAHPLAALKELVNRN